MNQIPIIATAETIIDAPSEKVWKALTDPDCIKQYMFGSTVQSDWKKGSSITWSGNWQGKEYVDHGKILEIIPLKRLQYTHFSPLSGLKDDPSNYHTVTIELRKQNEQTMVLLQQDNNESIEERKHSEKNWKMMLDALKKLVEGN